MATHFVDAQLLLKVAHRPPGSILFRYAFGHLLYSSFDLIFKRECYTFSKTLRRHSLEGYRNRPCTGFGNHLRISQRVYLMSIHMVLPVPKRVDRQRKARRLWASQEQFQPQLYRHLRDEPHTRLSERASRADSSLSNTHPGVPHLRRHRPIP